MTDGHLGFGQAWLSGKVKVEAGVRDLLTAALDALAVTVPHQPTAARAGPGSVSSQPGRAGPPRDAQGPQPVDRGHRHRSPSPPAPATCTVQPPQAQPAPSASTPGCGCISPDSRSAAR